MAYLTKHPKSKYWVASFRDIIGKRVNRSTKVEINPTGEDAKERAGKASENRRLAQSIADDYEQTSRGNNTESQVRKTLGDLYSRVNAGRELEFASCNAFLTQWLERITATKAKGTAARYSGTVKGFLKHLDAKAACHLGDINAADIQGFISERLKGGRNPTTVQTDLKTLNAPFALALRQGLILMNPVAAADAPSAEKEAREPFTSGEIAALLSKASEQWKTVILLAAFQGLRLGDATQLKWSNIDFAERVIRIRPQKTKAKKRDLVLPLHSSVEAHLKTLKAPAGTEDAPLSPKLSQCTTGGLSGLSRQFQAIMKTAGIEQESIEAGGDEGRKFNKRTFHSLRHSYVTRLEAAGVAPDQRMKLAGHSDTKSHARYTHTEVETLREALEKLV
jgi:integrase